MGGEFRYAFLWLGLFGVTACGEGGGGSVVEDPIVEDPIIEVVLDKTDVHFDASFGTDTIRVRGSQITNVEAMIDGVWLEVKTSADSIVIVTASANLTSENREAVVRIFTGADEIHSVPVMQEGSVFEVDVPDLTVQFGGRGNSLKINVTNTAKVPYTVVVPDKDKEWLSHTFSENEIVITASSSNTFSRESSVSLISGKRNIELSIKQIIAIEGDYILAYDNSYPDNKKNDDGTLICLPYQRKVTLKAGLEGGTYVINENLPRDIASLVFTYEHEKLSIKAGQKTGKVFSGNELTVKLYDTSKAYLSNDDELSYVAPLTVMDGCIDFTFGNTPYSASETIYSCDAIVFTTSTSNVHLMKNIKLFTDTGELQEIKEIDPPPPTPRIQGY
ncbi:hypothetical protein EZS27_015958 [termite gut metagenome]|uniref:Uncharacterized protein n=1 Tax=termite gut metagenome TaxID=433724 RepID=A0A5J4RQ83_9ZZZZ